MGGHSVIDVAQMAPTAAMLLAFGAVFRVWLKGFSGLVTAQQAQIDRALAAHATCETRLAKMEGELEGLRRQFAYQSYSQAVPLRPLSPEAEAAAARVHEIVERRRETEQ